MNGLIFLINLWRKRITHIIVNNVVMDAMRYIVIDGHLCGTGIRDKYNGGYILPESFSLSSALITKLKEWLIKYEAEFFKQYSNSEKIKSLDEEGEEIAILIKNECANIKVEYYSDAKMVTIYV